MRSFSHRRVSNMLNTLHWILEGFLTSNCSKTWKQPQDLMNKLGSVKADVCWDSKKQRRHLENKEEQRGSLQINSRVIVYMHDSMQEKSCQKTEATQERSPETQFPQQASRQGHLKEVCVARLLRSFTSGDWTNECRWKSLQKTRLKTISRW